MIFSLFVVALGALWASLALAHPASAAAEHGRPSLGLRPLSRWVRPDALLTPLHRRQDVDARASAKAAIDAMNTKFYSATDAIWSPSDPWWLSGVALTGVIDYMRKTGTADYLDQVKTIIREQRKAWPDGGGDFRADSTDDTGWWALAMVRMYDLTGDRAFLDISVEDEAYMYKYWTTSPCGGGMYVDIKAKTYKNAIANQLYMKLAASLHNRFTNDTMYLSRAKTAWSWLQGSGMINSENLFNDGLAMDSDGTCFNNHLPVWTYNQGVILGALVGASTPSPLHPSTLTPHRALPPTSPQPNSSPTRSSPPPPPCSQPPPPKTAPPPSPSSPNPAASPTSPAAATTTSKSSKASSPTAWPSWPPSCLPMEMTARRPRIKPF